MSKKSLSLLTLLLLVTACGNKVSSTNKESSFASSSSSSSLTSSSLTTSSSSSVSSSTFSSSSSSSSSSTSSSTSSTSSSSPFEDISLPDFDSSSSEQTGSYKLSIVYPETVLVSIHKYSEYEENGEVYWTLGDKVDYSKNLARGEYFLYVEDNPEVEGLHFMNTYGFEGDDLEFTYYSSNVFYFSWLDIKNTTVDITKYVSNSSETGEESYLGSYIAYELTGSLTTPIAINVTDKEISIDGDSYYLNKYSDTSFGFNVIYGNAKYFDGFLYLVNGDTETSTTHMYIAFDSASTFEIDALWEGVYNSNSFIIDTLIDGERELFYTRDNEIHTTLSSLEVTYEGTKLSDSTEIYLADYETKFSIHSDYYSKILFYINDENASNPKEDRHYFNFRQGGKEAGRYTLKDNPEGDILELDGFGKCKIGSKSGTYTKTVTSVDGVLVYRVVVTIPNESETKYILDTINGTYEKDVSLNSDPFVTKTTYNDVNKKYLKAVFNNGYVTLQDLTNTVSFVSNARYSVSNGVIRINAEYNYDYNYDTYLMTLSFRARYENDKYVLTLASDVSYYDEMSDYDTTLYAKGMELVCE